MRKGGEKSSNPQVPKPAGGKVGGGKKVEKGRIHFLRGVSFQGVMSQWS